MPALKKLPWVSVTTTLVTYSTLGWVLAAFHDPWFVWVMIVVVILLLAAFLSIPEAEIVPIYLNRTLEPFLSLLCSCFQRDHPLEASHICPCLGYLSAAILVRLEAQESRLSNRQTFWIFSDCIPSWLRARCSSANCNSSQF